METRPESTVEAIPLEDTDLGTGFDTEQPPEDLETTVVSDFQRARDSLPPYRQSAYLDAVDDLINAGRIEDAVKVLDETSVSGLAPVLHARKQLLQAEIDFEQGEMDRALRYVQRGLRIGNIDPTYVSRGLDLKGRLELRQGDPLEAVRTWIQRDKYLTETGAIADNNARIWYALGYLNDLDLQVASQNASGTLQGWLDLAILFLEFGDDPQGLRNAVTQWSSANPGHPAAGFSTALLGPERAPGVRQVALLLPLSSNYGAAARRVYDGFEAAHQRDGSPSRPQSIFYDIGGESTLAGNYVGVAASEGADVIVGPLGKAAVGSLLASREPPKPMVLLGSTSTDQPTTIPALQFDLAPEPEARQVAEFMYVSGHRRVAALYPDDEWGQRVYNAFLERWRELGGTLAEAQSFKPDEDDFTAPIKNLFNLTESETREALLQNTIGIDLDFDARRRQDIDALFLAARPGEARLIKPQINFFQGLKLPVYATSHVYAGKPDAVKDTDLDGIIFPDMPWVLRDTARMNKIQESLVDAGFSGVREVLFAFGHDAYQLSLLAPRPESLRDLPLRGLTGELLVDENGRVHRRLEWAQFRNGVPVKIWKR